jgi:hypothetical protein
VRRARRTVTLVATPIAHKHRLRQVWPFEYVSQLRRYLSTEQHTQFNQEWCGRNSARRSDRARKGVAICLTEH